MTLPEPTDIIAGEGSEGTRFVPADYLEEMLEGAYPHGVVVQYHQLKLLSRCHYDEGVRVFSVHAEDGTYLETLNLGAFRSVTEIQDALDEIVVHDPADRDEWVNR